MFLECLLLYSVASKCFQEFEVFSLSDVFSYAYIIFSSSSMIPIICIFSKTDVFCKYIYYIQECAKDSKNLNFFPELLFYSCLLVYSGGAKLFQQSAFLWLSDVFSWITIIFMRNEMFPTFCIFLNISAVTPYLMA